MSGQSPARYNPLDRLDPNGLDVAEDANTLADALVHYAPGQGERPLPVEKICYYDQREFAGLFDPT